MRTSPAPARSPDSRCRPLPGGSRGRAGAIGASLARRRDPPAASVTRAGYSRALEAVVRRSAIPYGYALTLWSSGAVLEHSHGTPSVGVAFLFVAGAVAGFALVASLASREPGPPLEPEHGDLIRAGFVQALAVGLALGAAGLVSLLNGTVVWPLGSFAATLVFLAVAGIELALSHALTERGEAERRSQRD